MSILDILQRRDLPLDYADYDKWPKILIDAVKKKHRPRARQLCEAAQLLCKGNRSLRDVAGCVGLPHTTLRYFIDRALLMNEDGRINGERAFVRFQIRSEYTATGKATKGHSGKFKALRKRYPEIKKIIKRELFRGRVLKDIHDAVKDYLVEQGFTDDDYPLNTDSQGEWAVWKYTRKFHSKYFRQIAKAKGGRDAERRADVTEPVNYPFPPHRPYLRIELDAHVLHAIFIVEIEELDGTIRTAKLRRLNVIAAIDSYSRAILGYRVSMNAQPTIEDVALTLCHVLDPMADEAPDILGYETGAGIGLPEHLVAKSRYRAFDELALDNALAHSSRILHRVLFKHINCAVNLGKSAHPEGRPLIEGWFKKLNRYLSDPLPSTTGSHPRDHRRRNPGTKAETYKISLSDLEELIESVIRRHNQESTNTTTGRKPLEEIQHYLTRSAGLVRKIRPEDRDLKFLFKRPFPRTIAGSVARGDRPYIQFKKAVYRNHHLSSLGALIGKPITFVVDIRDLRYAEGFLPSGESIGMLHAQGGWGLRAHSLQSRRAINRHLNTERVRGRIADPVRWYTDNLLSKRKRAASTPNVITRIHREVKNGESTTITDVRQSTHRRTGPDASWLDFMPDIDFDGETL